MKLSQFKFKLPAEQVALYPHYFEREYTDKDGKKETFRITRQDESRLMVLHKKSGTIDLFQKDENGNPIEGKYIEFRNIVEYFDEGDTFIFNDTKVFPARLYGTKEKTDAKIEVFLLRELNQEMRLWDVLVEPARKIRIGNKLFFDESGSMVAEVIDNTTSRGRTLRFLYDCPHEEFKKELYALGESPLPRYIIDNREETHATKEDLENFQCIFAKNEGAVTAPATGLHFSRELLKRMEIKGINNAFITLHCGLGSFNDIEVEDLTKHKMDSEQMVINAEACKIVNDTKRNRKKVCAVGTSVVKATETAVGTDGMLKEFDGWTNKFIFPPYDFGLSNTMVTNFYHPYSTLLMETAAFGGYELVMEAYDLAVKHGYMFGCFGDSLLILND
ncbi:tRNA preQ1(34) S-adenosylmethionine ribosyltransferase-isomerase QueA [Hoylesella nanceiensis]|jgi:S-adenosylmethionine:tRNA ribosyltransferase-isomerase|uniref:tRNA preQ1(34) S-adenosylmethionine ribosyltransferase-isomerase QueA n=1 Tax=Hoylesella nanceiensis TaxID=425941 RepID=UPI000364680C|nr:tRNA preQ1(34) S-adenosylmethionine ribosyltransferase-isomerase QueA [Hoylesella nanceiensis]MBF1441584.1 tRNA preQ1(34) S-adenosylmethionine ribosyltransferase-isomerase QueA [Hoylesella nanceiensis]MBW4767957.1 tRNA preQ1(34) S-adenosylmethionine ribosyltransferase-isomerase QueA [Hoylesella nanceiensis]MBW4834848.1 tRNA preQ1(34) S-adenosylmethionine ribosyltransferase-isomerase QueA [Hoylesella nanceiensis]